MVSAKKKKKESTKGTNTGAKKIKRFGEIKKAKKKKKKRTPGLEGAGTVLPPSLSFSTSLFIFFSFSPFLSSFLGFLPLNFLFSNPALPSVDHLSSSSLLLLRSRICCKRVCSPESPKDLVHFSHPPAALFPLCQFSSPRYTILFCFAPTLPNLSSFSLSL